MAILEAQEIVEHLAIFPSRRENFTTGNQIVNLFLQIWVTLHLHPVV